MERLFSPTMLPHALTIAGSDPSGGAGIQADLKTFHQHRVYGMSVITLIAAQNTCLAGPIHQIPTTHVAAQLDLILQDISIDALKIGAFGTAENAEMLSTRLQKLRCPKVLDPVMISKHGAHLLDLPSLDVLKKKLLPTLDLITPNIDEAEILTQQKIKNKEDAVSAAKTIFQMGVPYVLIKGGHLSGPPVDFLFINEEIIELSSPRIETLHTHGTGCTLSAAIAARLACGHNMVDAIVGAKNWLLETLKQAFAVGKGIGPINHFTKVDD